MKKLDKFRHAFMNGGGYAEKGGAAEVSLPCVWARWNPVCLVVMKAERLHGTVWVSDGPLLSPKGKESVQQQLLGNQCTYLQWSSMLIWILAFNDKAMWSVK